MDNKQDPNLSSPQESNTTKHINFREAEENAAGNSGDAGSGDEAAPEVKKRWEDLRKENEEQ